MSYEKALKEFGDKKKGHEGEVAFMGVIDSDGQLTRAYGNVCHASFRESVSYHFSIDDNKKIQYLLSAQQKRLCSKEEEIFFVDWLVNKSPYTEVFVNKDVDSILAYGHVIDPNQFSTLIGSALVATRFITESGGQSPFGRWPIFQEIIRCGESVDMAFLFSHLYTSQNSKQLYPMILAPLDNNHVCIKPAEHSLDYMKNFLAHKAIKGASFKERNGFGYGLASAWEAFDGSKTKADVLLGRLIPASQFVGKNHNIFAIKPKNQYALKNDKDLVNIIQQVKEML